VLLVPRAVAMMAVLLVLAGTPASAASALWAASAAHGPLKARARRLRSARAGRLLAFHSGGVHGFGSLIKFLVTLAVKAGVLAFVTFFVARFGE